MAKNKELQPVIAGTPFLAFGIFFSKGIYQRPHKVLIVLIQTCHVYGLLFLYPHKIVCAYMKNRRKFFDCFRGWQPVPVFIK